MKNQRTIYTLLMASSLFLSACQPDSEPTELSLAEEVPTSETVLSVNEIAPVIIEEVPVGIEHSLVPLPGLEENVPTLTQKTTILFRTTEGDILIEVYPEAAPNAVARFIELTETGFYDDTPFSRIVTGFVAQFGVNWREPHKSFQSNVFDDDASYFALDRGTLAFAKAGPNSNSTQVFINYAQNNRLASPQYNFTTFGKIVQGMNIVDRFVQVGDPDGGLDQARLWNDGEAYLAELEVKPTMILSAQVIE